MYLKTMNIRTFLIHAAFVLGTVSLLAASLAAGVKTQGVENRQCLRCHALPSLAVRDSVLGGIRKLSVNTEAFEHSIHGKLKCVECHKEGFSSWPHAANYTATGSLQCMGCHKDPKLQLTTLFADIHSEFEKSVHVTRLGSRFTCSSCHDPHSFQRQKQVSGRKIESANAMCLNCHSSEEQFSSLTKRRFPVLEAAHAWLPNQRIHWQHVRCVDCHSSYTTPNASHFILPKSQAVTNCESCHSKNSILLAKLYKYEHKENKQRGGFINGTLMNDAYVIGSTRNSALDVLSIAVFGLTIAGIAGHGFLRYRSRKKRRTQSGPEVH